MVHCHMMHGKRCARSQGGGPADRGPFTFKQAALVAGWKLLQTA